MIHHRMSKCRSPFQRELQKRSPLTSYMACTQNKWDFCKAAVWGKRCFPFHSCSNGKEGNRRQWNSTPIEYMLQSICYLTFIPHTRSTNNVKMNIKQILINDKWFHNNGTPNSLQHQTAFNSESTQKTVQSIRLFRAQQYNRIIVDYENCKIMMMSWRYCWIITSYWYLSLRKTLW